MKALCFTQTPDVHRESLAETVRPAAWSNDHGVQHVGFLIERGSQKLARGWSARWRNGILGGIETGHDWGAMAGPNLEAPCRLLQPKPALGTLLRLRN